MCEMLVRVVDKTNSDPLLDAKCTKRGDVIVIQPDGWVWGSAELTNPHWRIVKIPGLTVSSCLGFLGPELNTDPNNPNYRLRKRLFKLNLEALPDPGRQMQDVRRQNPIHKVVMSLADVLLLKIEKPPADNTDVFT